MYTYAPNSKDIPREEDVIEEALNEEEEETTTADVNEVSEQLERAPLHHTINLFTHSSY